MTNKFFDAYNIQSPYFKAAYIIERLYSIYAKNGFKPRRLSTLELTNEINRQLKLDGVNLAFTVEEMDDILINLRFAPFIVVVRSATGNSYFAGGGDDYKLMTRHGHSLLENERIAEEETAKKKKKISDR